MADDSPPGDTFEEGDPGLGEIDVRIGDRSKDAGLPARGGTCACAGEDERASLVTDAPCKGGEGIGLGNGDRWSGPDFACSKGWREVPEMGGGRESGGVSCIECTELEEELAESAVEVELDGVIEVEAEVALLAVRLASSIFCGGTSDG